MVAGRGLVFARLPSGLNLMMYVVPLVAPPHGTGAASAMAAFVFSLTSPDCVQLHTSSSPGTFVSH